MAEGFFRKLEPERDMTKEKNILTATDKMLDCFKSPLRKMIMIALSRGDKNIPDIIISVERLSLCKANTSVKKALDRLCNLRLIEKKGNIYTLTKNGEIFAKIFDISQEVFGDKQGAA